MDLLKETSKFSSAVRGAEKSSRAGNSDFGIQLLISASREFLWKLSEIPIDGYEIQTEGKSSRLSEFVEANKVLELLKAKANQAIEKNLRDSCGNLLVRLEMSELTLKAVQETIDLADSSQSTHFFGIKILVNEDLPLGFINILEVTN